MHRSGTSALARVLSLRGAALPMQLMPANAGNEKGYWEPERIVALNERILASLGLAWNDAFAADALANAGAIAPAFLDEARDILAAEYGDAPLIVLKDPRCTLLQAFWREALAGLGIAMSPVVVGRPPREVVASLVRRDGTSALGAGLLYAAYGVAAARTPAPAAFLTYAQLLDDWRGCTDRIAKELGFAWPRMPAGASVEIERFLGRKPRKAADPGLPGDVARLCDQAWVCLRARADGGACEDAALAGVEAALLQRVGEARPLLQDKNRALQDMSRQLAGTLAERDEALSVLRQAESDLRKAQADHARAELELEAARASGAQAVAERDTALRERDQALAVFEQAEGELRKAQADHARAEGELAEARASGTQAVAERDAALQERDQALAVFEQAESDLRKAQADHARVEGELAAARASGTQAVAERDTALQERDQALAVFKQAESELRKAQADHARA
jgi:hypothetical protein